MIDASRWHFYIGGHWVRPREPEVIDVIDSNREESFGSVSAGTGDDVNAAVAAAHVAFEEWRGNIGTRRTRWPGESGLVRAKSTREGSVSRRRSVVSNSRATAGENGRHGIDEFLETRAIWT
jgi:hypothetical protein